MTQPPNKPKPDDTPIPGRHEATGKLLIKPVWMSPALWRQLQALADPRRKRPK